MTTRIIRPTAFLIALLTPLAPALAGWRGGIGVLGDSYSDEYQFYPPHRSTARNWVEILAATRGLNSGRFSTQSRGEPRNQGYEYNGSSGGSARRGLKKADMLIPIGVALQGS